MIRPSLALVILLFSTICQAQEQKTLLWRIDGKDLKRPSYLFGTMHLTDRRVFFLSDSVYKAIERTEGFAAELDMHRVGMQMVNQMMQEKEDKLSREPIYVKDIVSPEIWDKYKEPLAKKLFKPANTITIDDLDDFDNVLSGSVMRKGEMPTFLDAYLFGIARKQGKWVGGIEDFEDQVEHINADDIEEKIQLVLYDADYYTKSIEQMIRIYRSEDLPELDTMMYRTEAGKKDFIMIKRNVKMAQRMDSLSAIRSTFFAVGAGHLPGDSGVIRLLRDRGFTVTPVISSKKINPDKYKYVAVNTQWSPLVIADNSYMLRMPGTADKFKYLEELGLDMQMYFDMSFMRMYMTMNIDIDPERAKLGKEELMNRLKAQYETKHSKVSSKDVVVNGTAGTELSFSTEDGEIRLQVFLPEMRKIILNGVFSYDEKALREPDTEKFFNTFYLKELPERKPVLVDKKWELYERPALGFKVLWPVKPKEKKDVQSDEDRISYEYMYVDVASQIFYAMSVSELKKPLENSFDEKLVMEKLKGYFEMSLEGYKLLDSSDHKVSGYPAYWFKLRGSSKGDEVEAQVLTIFRGSRFYYINATYQPKDAARALVEQFMKSFVLTEYRYPEWKTVTSPMKDFSTFSPLPIETVTEEELFGSQKQKFVINDTLAATQIAITKENIPGWFWYSSDTAFLNERMEDHRSWSDTVTDYSTSFDGKIRTVSFIVRTPNSAIIKKVKLFLTGKTLYSVSGMMPETDQMFYGAIFDKFTLNNVPAWNDRTKLNAGILSDHVRLPGKLDHDQLYYWWEQLEVKAEDLPHYFEMFLHYYPPPDSTYVEFNTRIFSRLYFADTTYRFVKFIRDNYSRISQKDELAKPYIISLLSNMQTEESYLTIKELLNNHSFPQQVKSAGSHGFNDSLQLTKLILPEILKYSHLLPFSQQLEDLMLTMLDSNLISADLVKEKKDIFIANATKALDEEMEMIEEEGYIYAGLIRVLGIINTKESNDLLQRFSKVSSMDVKFSVLQSQLKNNLTPDQNMIYSLSSNDGYRYKVYDELRLAKKLKLFPLSYTSILDLGRSKLYTLSEQEYLTDCGYIKDKTARYKGKDQKFVLFRATFYGTSYLGVIGPVNSGYKDLGVNDTASGIYTDEEIDEDKIDAQLKAYLKSLEED